jgi:hypothetical protein
LRFGHPTSDKPLDYRLVVHATRLAKQIFVHVGNLRFLSRTKKGGQKFIFLLPFLAMPNNAFVLQPGIERTTGHGIEQLRKWRQRFGFPPAQYGLDAEGQLLRCPIHACDGGRNGSLVASAST